MRSAMPIVCRALFRSFGCHYLLIGLWKLAWAACTWLCAYYLLKEIIQFEQDVANANTVASPLPSTSHGYAYAIALGGVSLLQCVCIHHMLAECTNVGIQVRSSLIVMVYRKSLKLSEVQSNIGEIVNLVSNSCTAVADACVTFHYLWSAFVEVALILILAGVEIGVASLPAMAFVLLLLPLQVYLAHAISSTAVQFTLSSARLTHLVSEILTVIKLIKFYAWENHFIQRANEARLVQMKHLRHLMLFKMINFAAVFSTPVLTALIAFLYYQSILDSQGDLVLSPVVSFTLLSLYN